MSSIKVIHPLLLERWQSPSWLSLGRLACELSKLFEIRLKVGVYHQKPWTVALLCDAILFPSALFFQRWQLCLAGQNARGGYGLPFEDLESQPSTNLLQSAIGFV